MATKRLAYRKTTCTFSNVIRPYEISGYADDGGRWTDHRMAAHKARRSLEEELYRALDEDTGNKMKFKIARDRMGDGRDVKRCAVSKDSKGRLITESKEVLTIRATNLKELLNRK